MSNCFHVVMAPSGRFLLQSFAVQAQNPGSGSHQGGAVECLSDDPYTHTEHLVMVI